MSMATLLKFIEKKSFHYRLATFDGDASLAGLWVDKDDLTRERSLGAIAAVDPRIISIEAVEQYLVGGDQGRASRARRTGRLRGNAAPDQTGDPNRRHRLAIRATGVAQVA